MNHGGNVWQGGDPAAWLDYSANIRPGGPPEWVKNAILGAMDKVRYYPQLGMENAKAALAAFLGLKESQVLPTSGGISAIALAARLGADRVRIPAPAFLEYAQISEQNGLTVELRPLLDGHRVKSPAEALGQDLSENCCVWLCNPSNPVGAGFTPGQITELLDAVEAKNGWLVVDEAFIDYCPELTSVKLVADRSRLVITGSMTKILGIPGVRLGYLAAGEVMPRLAGYQTPWDLNCFAEAVLLALPENRDDVKAEGERSAAARERFRKELERLGIFVYPSASNFLLCDFGRQVRPLEDALKERKILVRRCMNFPGIDDGRHLRLAVKDDASNARFIKSLEEAMQCAENH